MFVIKLNHLEGVELILKALRERVESKGCGASGPLADGIEKTLVYVGSGPEESSGAVEPKEKTKPGLSVVK